MTNTMSCGCEIISDNLGAYKIEYCPIHKAAPDMYKACLYARTYLPNSQLIEKSLAKAGGKC